MSIVVPLGVRLYNIEAGVDVYITRYVDDFQFRHTAPGGCASLTLNVHPPPGSTMLPSAWGLLYSRVQVIDLRSAEVLWEGRVEDPATQTGDASWELGVLGSAVAATDITRPILYADNTLEYWEPKDADAFQHTKDEPTQSLITRMVEGFLYSAGSEFPIWTYVGASAAGTIIARVATTYDGSGPNATHAPNFDILLDAGPHGNIDVTAFSVAGLSYKANILPTDIPTTDYLNQVDYEVRRRSGTGNYVITSGDVAVARLKYPKILGMRIDRFGNPLMLATDYNHGDFVYVRHVVEDVVGRFLNASYRQGLDLVTWDPLTMSGYRSVKGEDCFIDTTSTAKIQNLKWIDGANAKTILDTLTTVQTNAYWAIWESSHFWDYPASINDLGDHGFRFEWARWPTSWNYLASAKDGFQSQRDGESLYDHIFMQTRYENSNTPSVVDSGTGQGSSSYTVEELSKKFNRSIFVNRETQILQTEDPYLIAYNELQKYRFVKDTGTLTVRRPIPMVDGGTTSHHGFAGMVQPWEIRPGKLIKVTDILPEGDGSNFSFDTGPLPDTHHNCVFRVVATTYNTADNSCVIELDQLPKWRIATQIAKPSSGGKAVAL